MQVLSEADQCIWRVAAGEWVRDRSLAADGMGGGLGVSRRSVVESGVARKGVSGSG